MNQVVFETATIADVLTKAARATPKPNTPMFTQTPGIYIQVTDEAIIVRATDTEIFYTQWTTCIEKTTGTWEWQVSDLLADWIETLPMGTGKQVTFTADKGILMLKSGSSLKKIPLIINSNYPHWDAFDSSQGMEVSDFSEKLDQVAWAAALSADGVKPGFSGIYLDGKYMIALNGYRAARIDFEFPVAAQHGGLTIPYKMIAPILRKSVEVKFTSLGHSLGIEPDDYSQIKIFVFADNPGSSVNSLPVDDSFDHKFEFNTEVFTDVLKRILKSATKAENPIAKLMIANESLIISMKGGRDEINQEIVEIPGYGTHEEPALISFNPDDLLRAISKTPSKTAAFYYNIEPSRVNYINSGNYDAWLARKADVNVEH